MKLLSMRTPQVEALKGMSPLGIRSKPQFEIKRMLEPQGTTFGIYRDGKLFEYGFLTEQAAQNWLTIANKTIN